MRGLSNARNYLILLALISVVVTLILYNYLHSQNSQLRDLSSIEYFQNSKSINDKEFLTWDQDDARLISYIRTHHLVKPSTLSSKSSKNRHPNDLSSRVLKHLDKTDKEWKGSFVEAGAYDGIAGSNTMNLENMGWEGLLVEPNPFLYPKLVASNRKAWKSNACLSPSNTAQVMNFTSMKISPSQARLGKPMSAKEFADHGISSHAKYPWFTYELSCFPLYSILKATNQFKEIDFLSLDVQGAEIGILKHFPFDKFKIKTMLVEIFTFTKEELADLRNFLAGKGYKVEVSTYIDDLYVLQEGRNS